MKLTEKQLTTLKVIEEGFHSSSSRWASGEDTEQLANILGISGSAAISRVRTKGEAEKLWTETSPCDTCKAPVMAAECYGESGGYFCRECFHAKLRVEQKKAGGQYRAGFYPTHIITGEKTSTAFRFQIAVMHRDGCFYQRSEWLSDTRGAFGFAPGGGVQYKGEDCAPRIRVERVAPEAKKAG